MEPKKIAASTAAAFALATGSFVAGQKAAQPTPTAHVVAASFEPVPALIVAVKGPDGTKRRRVACRPAASLDGKPSPSLAGLCDPLLVFSKTIADKVGSLAGDLSK